MEGNGGREAFGPLKQVLYNRLIEHRYFEKLGFIPFK
jgi:hypothetical protein